MHELNESNELKLCPFCGGSAQVSCCQFIDADDELFWTYCVECKVCGCCTPYMSRENAVETWNERK